MRDKPLDSVTLQPGFNCFMKRSARLKVVHDLAKRREGEYAKALAAGRQAFDAESAKLTELIAYQSEYGAKKKQYGSGIAGVGALENLSRFLLSLDQAIEQQRLTVSNYEQQLQRVKLEWARRHNKAKKLAELIERYAREEDQVEEKKVQKELDDQASLRSKPFF